MSFLSTDTTTTNAQEPVVHTPSPKYNSYTNVNRLSYHQYDVRILRLSNFIIIYGNTKRMRSIGYEYQSMFQAFNR